MCIGERDTWIYLDVFVDPRLTVDVLVVFMQDLPFKKDELLYIECVTRVSAKV